MLNILPFEQLICPLDALPLTREHASWVCPHGHSFDIAAKGQVNLLPVQHKHSREPGDHKQMVLARRQFLNAGHYQPIARAINHVLLSRWEGRALVSCLDAGCGEGYYLRELASAERDGSLALLGIDISKWAVLSAARQDRRPAWVVASNARLPVVSESIDAVLCLFGFPVYAEFKHVIVPGGLLLKADAGPDHLRELRDIIYPQRKTERATEPPCPDGFVLLSRESLRYSIHLDTGEVIANLLAMTPHYYRAGAQGRRKADALREITLTIDVTLSCWERVG